MVLDAGLSLPASRWPRMRVEPGLRVQRDLVSTAFTVDAEPAGALSPWSWWATVALVVTLPSNP